MRVYSVGNGSQKTMRTASRNCNAWLSKWLAELEWSECIALAGVHLRFAQAACLWQVAQI
jgi:hypothetical protein